jgi:asparaginyl-tRNA synthetase
MEVEEALVAHVVTRVLEVHARDLVDVLERDLAPLQAVTAPFPRISYDEAVERLHATGFPDFPWGEDLGAPHETALASAFEKPVFVYHYPAKCKAFYMAEVAGDSRLSRSVDLLAPEGYGEIVGSGERATDIALLQRRMVEHGLSEEVYAWYLDLRRFGSVPHSGFGLGLERTVAWICGLEHVRETIAFPRMLERIWP